VHPFNTVYESTFWRGPQSLIVVPASTPNHKKAEVELQAV